MKVLDLFSGIGGFSLAASWMNWETVAFVEKDEFCQKVLLKNFGKDIEIYDDITKFSAKPFRGRCDIITGGFPCQPFSQGGKQKGKDDDRHLFPEMLRVVEEARPRWVVAENVRGLLSIGNGTVFEEVAASLEGIGYSVQTFCIPACAVNAPHRRDRLWIIGNSDSFRPKRTKNREGSFKGGNGNAERSDEIRQLARPDVSRLITANTASERLEGLAGSVICRESNGFTSNDRTATRPHDAGTRHESEENLSEQWRQNWLEVATEFCTLDDGISNGLVRPKGWRLNALKAAGNSAVPQIIYQIFKAIEYAETNG